MNSNPEKSFDEKYNDPGAFQYHDDGFTFSHEGFIKKFAWIEITQLNVYKVDQVVVDTIEMEIVYGDKYFIIGEEFPGWYQFVLKTKEAFPSIPKDWDITIVLPAFEPNYRTIYDKSKENTANGHPNN